MMLGYFNHDDVNILVCLNTNEKKKYNSHRGVVRIPRFDVDWKFESGEIKNYVSRKMVFVFVVWSNNIVVYNINDCSSCSVVQSKFWHKVYTADGHGCSHAQVCQKYPVCLSEVRLSDSSDTIDLFFVTHPFIS